MESHIKTIVCELFHKLSNNVRLKILVNLETIGKSQNTPLQILLSKIYRIFLREISVVDHFWDFRTCCRWCLSKLSQQTKNVDKIVTNVATTDVIFMSLL